MEKAMVYEDEDDKRENILEGKIYQHLRDKVLGRIKELEDEEEPAETEEEARQRKLELVAKYFAKLSPGEIA
jgi:hypothetical protein